MNNRFYEGLCPAFEGEPLKSDIEIVSNEVVGEGLRSKKSHNVGDLVFKFHGEKVEKINLYTLEHPDGYHIYDPIVMGKALHSCDPNMDCDMRAATFTARRPILPGDYLTMDYSQTESVLYRPFECSCGSDNCRGTIYGKNGKTLQEEKVEFYWA